MLEQELILDRYRIIDKAGSGGYATVQHAFDTHLKRDVAIKCIRITRADVDAAKRTAAILKQLNLIDNPSIPIGSSRVIPAGGATGLRKRQEAERSLFERANGKRGMVGVTDMGTANPLPQDPSFLTKREERLQKGRSKNGRRATDLRHMVNQGQGAPGNLRSFAPYAGDDRLVQTRDIPALANMLPGAISGAGQAKIQGIDDAVNVQLVRQKSEIPFETLNFDGVQGYARNGEWVPNKKPSFLKNMDAHQHARWHGDGSSSELGDGACSDDFYEDGYGQVQDYGYTAEETYGSEERGRRPANTRTVAARVREKQNYTRSLVAPVGEPSGPEEVTAEEVSQLETVPGLEEARTAAHLNDANIVTVYDCVVHGDTAYVIMEYVEGKTLAKIIREMGDDITLDMITAVFAGVAHALQVAHKANVLHLDIKPENVIVNKEGIVKVTDFGLSTLMDASGRGKTGGGTIGYMPLEQMRRRPLDVRTDEWALASLTYEMLSGSNPFRAKSLADAEIAIEDAEIILPSRCWDGMSERVDDVMFTALAPDMDGRYASIGAFSKALITKLGDEGAGRKQLAAAVGAGAEGEKPEDQGPSQSVPVKRGLFGGLFGGKTSARANESYGPDALHHTSALPAASAHDDYDSHDFDEAYSDDLAYSENVYERGERSARASAARQPVIDRIGEQGATLIMRLFAAAAGAMISVVALLNFRMLVDTARTSSTVPDTTFGLFSISPIVAFVALAVLVVASFVKPKIGYVVTFAAFAISLMISQAWLPALLLLLGMGAWWWYFGRHSDAACTLVMMQPLLGAFGFSSIVPVAAGAVLDVKEAASVAGASLVSAIVFASLGSADLLNWDVMSNFIVAVNPVIAGSAITNGLTLTLSSTTTWLTALAWLGGASVYALFCRKGTAAFDVAGGVVCAVLLVLGCMVAPVLLGMGSVLAPLTVVGTVVPAALAVLLAAAHVTDRVRMAEGEW